MVALIFLCHSKNKITYIPISLLYCGTVLFELSSKMMSQVLLVDSVVANLISTLLQCKKNPVSIWFVMLKLYSLYTCWLDIFNNICIITDISLLTHLLFLYSCLKNGPNMPWPCPSVCLSICPSIRLSFSDFFLTCFEISIWNLVYAFSRWHDMLGLSFITFGSLWPSLQPKVGETQFLQLWPYKSR